MTRRTGAFLAGGLLLALLLAGVVSNFASAQPDGLDATLLKGCTVDVEGEITGGSCPAQRSRKHELADGPLAGYGVRGIDNPYLATGLSGVVGVLLTFAVGGGLFWLVRRRRPAPDGPAPVCAPPDGPAVDRAAPVGPAAGSGRDG